MLPAPCSLLECVCVLRNSTSTPISLQQDRLLLKKACSSRRPAPQESLLLETACSTPAPLRRLHAIAAASDAAAVCDNTHAGVSWRV
jgi:hypothetical protein